MPSAVTMDHVALIVRDPVRTAALLESVFATQAIHRRDDQGHDESCLQLGGLWFVLVAADVERPLTGDHVAFHATAGQMQAVADALRQRGHPCQMARSDTALYFTDFDNHVFEINTTGMQAEMAGMA